MKIHSAVLELLHEEDDKRIVVNSHPMPARYSNGKQRCCPNENIHLSSAIAPSFFFSNNVL
jgi:hypothetical protein